ncbi:MauE/DoxX family redox-associated membrane protein [Novosphingobium sp. FKTRR1]|uniref:MauE/DoxX family redox-associated membrane protein n=1 Tax=Novosphingobium sp. FKTRR1 TaxID=2879118 RepID=UPI001CF0659D
MSDLALQLGPVASLAGAIGIGLVFVQAGAAKLRHRDVLPGVIANYRLLPDALVAPLAAVLPPFEIVLGLVLAATGDMAAALVAVSLLLGFAGAMAINVARGRTQIDCGCGRSQLRQPIGWPLVLRNLVMAALLAPACAGSFRTGGAEIGAQAVALAAVAGLMLFLLYQLFNAIVALSASPLASGRR